MATPSSYDAPFLRDVVTRTTEGILTVDRRGRIVFANPAVDETLGYEADELIDKPLDILFDDTQANPVETVQQASQKQGESGVERLTMLRQDGRPVSVVCSSKPVEYDSEQYLTLTIQETGPAIPGDAETRETESESNQLLQRVFDQSKEAVFLFDADQTDVLDCNAAARELLGNVSKPRILQCSPRNLFGQSEDDVVEFLQRVRETQETLTADMRCYPLEGDEIRVEMSASTVEVGTQQRFLSHVRPRERQFEEKETIQKQTAAIEAAIDGVAILDENGEYEYVNEAHASIYGYDDPGDLIGNSWRCLYGDAEVGRFEEQILPEVRETGSWQGEAIGERADGSSFPQMVSLSTVKSGGLVCVVRDVSDVKTGIDIDDTWLTRLNEMGQELMQAQRRATIADVALDTVGRLFEYDVACVRLLDDEENTLDIEAASDTATSLIESEPACDLEGTFAGQAYRQGETLVRTAENSGVLAATPVAASMHLPLGEFGVLTVASTEAASFTEVDVEGAKMLAASVEAALNRAERERQLREQTEDLQQQRNQLETVNQVNKLVHDLVGELFNASSREDIQQRVCDRLSESRLYKSAWIGELTVTGDGISVTAAAGLEEDSMQDVDELPVDVIGNGTVKEALSEGEVVDNRRYRVHDDGITDNPDDSMEATAAVPIQYDGRAFGVLVVNATHQDAFATVGTESLAILGDIIGFAINAVENRELLLSNKTVQLEFEVTDEDCLAVAITKDLGCYCRMQQTIQSSDGQYLSYVECEGVAGDEALDTIAAIDTVTHCRVISDQGNRCVVEVKREGCGSEVMMEYGATMQRADAENGVGSLVIEAPQSVNVRQIVEAYEEYNPDSELVAKRELERPVKTAAEFRSSLEEQLTDRQTAAITAAYFSGYYEWPRESTGEEIAESMDISSATLHQHIRSAHKEFLTAFLENGTQSPTDPI